MRCVIDDKEVDLQNILGEGGEARVYEYQGKAVKIWKKPNDPSIPDAERHAVGKRMAVLPMKMAAFPNFAPRGVVCPIGLVHATGRGREVIGYIMPMATGISLRKWSENRPDWQVQKRGLSDLWYAVKGLHQHNIVWGDANDLNVLMSGTEASIIDADSLQFGRFRCTTFTQRFADPRLLKGGDLARPHDEESDWYAWLLMTYISMTGISPWDGTPTADRHGKIPAWDHRIKCPKWVVPHANLGPWARQVFEDSFVRSHREIPTLELFDLARRDCAACGKWVWGATCACGLTERPVSMNAYHSCKSGRKLVGVWVHTGNIKFLESDSNGDLFEGGTRKTVRPMDFVDLWDGERQETNIGGTRVLLRLGGIIKQVTKLTGVQEVRIGSMIKGRSQIWGGPEFGFGLSQLEESWSPMIIDGAVLDIQTGPAIRGRIYEAAAYTSDAYVWLGIDDGVSKRFECWDRRGQYVERILVDNIRGAVAYKNFLFIPEDGRIIRIEAKGPIKEFPALVHSRQALIISKEGLSIWDENEIRHIKV